MKDEGARGHHQHAATGRDHNQIHMSDLGVFAETVLYMAQYERDERVQPFADRLEHYQTQWNAGQSVEHAKRLASHRHRCTVAVA